VFKHNEQLKSKGFPYFTAWLSALRSRLTRRTEPLSESPSSAAGRKAEDAAARYLVRDHGYRLLCRNWRQGRDEIDLICSRDDVLVFVEVKGRRDTARVPGYYAVDQRKKKALRRACNAYLYALPRPPATHRFDIVEVRFCADGRTEVSHFENIPLFTKRRQRP
jgi:putative endonuclease